MISRNHTGHRVGQSHHRAKLTDAQVREMRELRERHGWKYAALALKFGCGESTVRDICTYRTRWAA